MGIEFQTDFPVLLNDPEVNKIASVHNKSPAQIAASLLILESRSVVFFNEFDVNSRAPVLRWIYQRPEQIIAIPKSTNANRLKENSDIFDFELDNAQFDTISALNRDHRYLPFPMIVQRVRMFGVLSAI